MNSSELYQMDELAGPLSVTRAGSSETRETIASYDQVAVGFAARWGDLRLTRTLDAFTSRVAGQRRVLDLGCGPGRDVDFLTQMGCRVVGLDLSAGMLAQACGRLPGALLAQADLRYPPLATASFDGIWACASLLHLPRSQFPTAVAEMARLLRRPGGVLYLAMKGGRGQRWITDDDGRRFFFTYYQPAELETILRHAGFRILERWEAPHLAGQKEPWLSSIARVDNAW